MYWSNLFFREEWNAFSLISVDEREIPEPGEGRLNSQNSMPLFFCHQDPKCLLWIMARTMKVGNWTKKSFLSVCCFSQGFVNYRLNKTCFFSRHWLYGTKLLSAEEKQGKKCTFFAYTSVQYIPTRLSLFVFSLSLSLSLIFSFSPSPPSLSLSPAFSLSLTPLSLYAPSMNTECNYRNDWIKKKNGHICKNLIQNGEPQRSLWGTQKQKKTQPCLSWGGHLSLRPLQSQSRNNHAYTSRFWLIRWATHLYMTTSIGLVVVGSSMPLNTVSQE